MHQAARVLGTGWASLPRERGRRAVTLLAASAQASPSAPGRRPSEIMGRMPGRLAGPRAWRVIGASLDRYLPTQAPLESPGRTRVAQCSAARAGRWRAMTRVGVRAPGGSSNLSRSCRGGAGVSLQPVDGELAAVFDEQHAGALAERLDGLACQGGHSGLVRRAVADDQRPPTIGKRLHDPP